MWVREGFRSWTDEKQKSDDFVRMTPLCDCLTEAAQMTAGLFGLRALEVSGHSLPFALGCLRAHGIRMHPRQDGREEDKEKVPMDRTLK